MCRKRTKIRLVSNYYTLFSQNDELNFRIVISMADDDWNEWSFDSPTKSPTSKRLDQRVTPSKRFDPKVTPSIRKMERRQILVSECREEEKSSSEIQSIDLTYSDPEVDDDESPDEIRFEAVRNEYSSETVENEFDIESNELLDHRIRKQQFSKWMPFETGKNRIKSKTALHRLIIFTFSMFIINFLGS